MVYKNSINIYDIILKVNCIMKMITTSEKLWAETLLNEISNNGQEWWWPVSDKHQVFEQALMQFVNGNLNYFNFENMLLSVVEGYRFNRYLPKTLEFCEYVRTLTNDRGPFGRMCVWQIPPRAELLPHKDSFKYHVMIVRNIFVISKHNNSNSIIDIAGTVVNYDQGTLFQFHPGAEEHSFKNNSDEPWYFLGFDYWNPKMLFHCLKTTDLISTFNNKTRQESSTAFGIGDCKYMSNN